MTTEHTRGIARGRALADELVGELSETFDRFVGRVMAEYDHPAAQIIVVTQLKTMADVYFNGQLGPVRQEALRRMRFPDGDLTGTPAMGWPEIATAVGMTPGRAQRVSGLPPDRSAPRPRRATS